MRRSFDLQKQRASVSAESPPDLECTNCRVAMTAHFGAENRIRYYCCPSCGRWASSTYTEALRGDAKVRVQTSQTPAPRSSQFQQAKERLERWMSALDQQDPYYLMGVSPQDSAEAIRNRYRELALRRHPDRGGSALDMLELNMAYDRIVRHRTGTGSGDDARLVTSSLPGGGED